MLKVSSNVSSDLQWLRIVLDDGQLIRTIRPVMVPQKSERACPIGMAIQTAQTRWPLLPRVDELGAFAQFVSGHWPVATEAEEVLRSERGAQLVLAYACSLGHQGALQAFDEEYGTRIDAILASTTEQHSVRTESKQLLWQALMLPRPAAPPKIALYSGRGSLLAFVKVVGVRIVIAQLQMKKRLAEDSDDVLLGYADCTAVPLDQYMNKLYSAECKRAFAQGLETLTPRERTLLRYHIVDQLSIDQICGIYQVHRATAARWIQSARQSMVNATHHILMELLEVGKTELQSVLRLMDTDLDVSAERLLRATIT